MRTAACPLQLHAQRAAPLAVDKSFDCSCSLHVLGSLISGTRPSASQHPCVRYLFLKDPENGRSTLQVRAIGSVVAQALWPNQWLEETAALHLSADT